MLLHAVPPPSATYYMARSAPLASTRAAAPAARPPLYTADERRRRDASKWTLVQGILAPLQFLLFAVSAVLVVRFLVTGQGLAAANVSVVAKTLALYAIMYTGALWEHDVYGRYLFAPAFYWEDVVSMVVIALHSYYLYALATDALAPRALMYLALAAYATYVVNAGQFLLKLRAARLAAGPAAPHTAPAGAHAEPA
jgi:3-vinyl bacteriochlorophyllide hydratase